MHTGRRRCQGARSGQLGSAVLIWLPDGLMRQISDETHWFRRDPAFVFLLIIPFLNTFSWLNSPTFTAIRGFQPLSSVLSQSPVLDEWDCGQYGLKQVDGSRNSH